MSTDTIKEIIKNNSLPVDNGIDLCLSITCGGIISYCAASNTFLEDIPRIPVDEFSGSISFNECYQGINTMIRSINNDLVPAINRINENNIKIHLITILGATVTGLTNVILNKNIALYCKHMLLDNIMADYIFNTPEKPNLLEKYKNYIKSTKTHSISDFIMKIFGISTIVSICLGDKFSSILTFGLISIGAGLVRKKCNLKEHERCLLEALD